MLNKKTNNSSPKIIKPIKILAAVMLSLVALCVLLWLYNYIDMRINKPLGNGNDFTFIQQEVSRGPFAMPTEIFYYATDVPPKDVTSKFEGWTTRTDISNAEMGTRTDIKIEKGDLYAYVTYCSREQCKQDPIGVSDFKGKKYIFYILGESMYLLNPNNIHSSMKQSVLDAIKSKHIR